MRRSIQDSHKSETRRYQRVRWQEYHYRLTKDIASRWNANTERGMAKALEHNAFQML